MGTMKNNWICQFQNSPKKITVGQKLIMLCEGEESISFNQPVHIQFLDKKQAYSLHVLKTLNTKEKGFLALEVTSYRTGEFKKPFILTDGNQKILIKDFSFSVQSLLNETKKSPQVHGPFGPFKPPIHLWYLSTISISFIFLFSCLCIFLYRLFNRKTFIKTILRRNTYTNSSKSFILGLRKQKNTPLESLKQLEFLFKTFLEDHFFIPAIKESNKQILKNLKRHQKAIYKKEGQTVFQILNEFSSLNTKSIDRNNFLKLKKVCQQTVFLLDKKKDGK